MEIYLDANATTPVLPQARAAALAVMEQHFGNPGSTHAHGLRARALLDAVRAKARRVLDVHDGRIVFTSGATEGIQTAVLSALLHLRAQGRRGALLYGATEHKAVPEALRHWNAVLGLDLPLRAIPVGPDGRHDLAWLHQHARDAGLVCTMAANNETGVISELDGIAQALADSPALWLVDGVQALGKLALRLAERRIDYAPFSGHKLYAPKGIGMLYVRAGAPFTPLIVGGGQEQGARSGTENMAGIAALGAVFDALLDGGVFAGAAQMRAQREQLLQALRAAFPQLQLHTPLAISLPTTLNFSVPGVSAAQLLDLFDAAGLRLSGGSACSAARALPSAVLKAMGRTDDEAAQAVRLSFGAADDASVLARAAERFAACGAALRAQGAGPLPTLAPLPPQADAAWTPAQLRAALARTPRPLVVDVRELAEQQLAPACGLAAEAAPLSQLDQALPRWQALPAELPVVFVCRSGARSARAAQLLRQAGRASCWSLAGGLALWSAAGADQDAGATPQAVV